MSVNFPKTFFQSGSTESVRIPADEDGDKPQLGVEEI